MVKAKFARNEIVLAKQKTLFYPAKIIKVDDNKKPVQYFVHYNGWTKKWDEWVPENNMIKHNAKGLAMQVCTLLGAPKNENMLKCVFPHIG